MRDALVLVDVINDFRHEDGQALLRSFRERLGGLQAAIRQAREREIPVVYANDNEGIWDGDAKRLVRHAVEQGLGGDLVAAVAPEEGDRFVVKPRYSAFDHTPFEPSCAISRSNACYSPGPRRGAASCSPPSTGASSASRSRS